MGFSAGIFRGISRGWQRPKLRLDCFRPKWPLTEQRSPKSFSSSPPSPSFLVPVQMSSSLPINQGPDLTAPTPQNTPLQHAPLTAGLSRPTVPDITEGDEPEEDDAPDTTDLQGALAGLVHGRLAGLLGKSSGYVENLPTEVKRSLEGLKGLQVKQTALQNQYKMECLELEKKVCLCDYRFFS